METGEAILRYWFGSPRPDGSVAEESAQRWFAASDETDGFVGEHFGRSLEQAGRGELADWALTARGRLALVILLDQFSRNVHRGTPRAFAHDALALRLCVDGIAAGMDRELAPIERAFFYMPLEHAEDREAQRRSVACFERLADEAPAALAEQLRGFLDYARRHREVIERFGRFPHRNPILGRPSTPEERAFLAEHEGFLQAAERSDGGRMTGAGTGRTVQPEGVAAALAAAGLFGVSAPLAKMLLPGTGPLPLAALLYLGAGLGLAAVGALARGSGPREARLRRADVPLLAVVVTAGGIVGPVLLLHGLQRVSGVVGSLLLNLEAPLTILLAVAVFGEHLGRRGALAAALVALGAALLGHLPGAGVRADWRGVAAIVGACLAWAIDNNATQRLSVRDPVAVARVKGLGAGASTLALALGIGLAMPPARRLLGALALGFVGYGLSVVLAVRALRILGAARQAALFATAPFVGAVAAVPLLDERFGVRECAAGALMALGVTLLLGERHLHAHAHEPLEHDHVHVHDEHHRHAHDGGAPAEEPHAHPHVHAPLEHAHPHVSDVHHRHRH